MTSLSPIMLGLHAIAATIWVGGMFFAYLVLRPSVPGIEHPPERLKLWDRVFEKFFFWVWIAVVALPSTGYYQLYSDFEGFGGAGAHIHIMHLTGWLMIVLFVYLYMKPYAAFRVPCRPKTGQRRVPIWIRSARLSRPIWPSASLRS